MKDWKAKAIALLEGARSGPVGTPSGIMDAPSDRCSTNRAGNSVGARSALFDGFSAQLASPEVGLGINRQCIIDKPWSVVCDLANNPPNLQALGYLFL